MRRVNLKEYPKVWEKLKIYAVSPYAPTVQELLKTKFGLTVQVKAHDTLGYVLMEESSYTWLILKWL